MNSKFIYRSINKKIHPDVNFDEMAIESRIYHKKCEMTSGKIRILRAMVKAMMRKSKCSRSPFKFQIAF